LLRIVRIVRLLRFDVFREMLLMIRGMSIGARTLFWSVVLLVGLIFCLGLLFRQTVGAWCKRAADASVGESCVNAHLQLYSPVMFSTFYLSCFTVFRCLTEGCTSVDGSPLMVHLMDNGWWGSLMVLFFSIVYVSVQFGLFNLIMAVFVQTTMENARVDECRRRRVREAESVQVAKRLQRLLFEFCHANNRTSASSDNLVPRLSFRDAASMVEMQVSRELFEIVIADPRTTPLLEDLEIQVSDPMNLFDALDADGNGILDVSELVGGLMKLRGAAEKSDVIAAVVSVRSLQERFAHFEDLTVQNWKKMHASLERLESRLLFEDFPSREVS